MEKRIYLLRHGRTAGDQRYLGATDIPLAQTGVAQIAAMQKSLRKKNFDAVFCSPLRRCRETATILNLGAEIECCAALQEIDFGRWENKTFEEVAEEEGTLVANWQQDPTHFTFPEGESLAAFSLRINTIVEMIQGHSGQQILLITHGGVIRYLICKFLRIHEIHNMLFGVHPGRLAIVDLFSQGGILSGLNLSEVFDG